MKNNRCMIPFMVMTIESDGIVQLCPSSQYPLEDLSEGVNPKTLEQIWYSQSYSHVRDSLRLGILPQECLSCSKLENSGIESRRQRFSKKYIKINGHSSYDNFSYVRQPNISQINIAFSNKCNLQCAMCSSRYSHSWNPLEEEYYSKGIDFRENKRLNNFEVSDELMESLKFSLSRTDNILIKGGEPFLSPRTYELLDHLIKLDCDGVRIPHIYIQTNGTIVNDKILSYLTQLNIEIGISIDGIDSTYEWIRGFSFSQIIRNIEYFMRAQEKSGNGEKVFLDYTTSIFNVNHSVVAFSKLEQYFKKFNCFGGINTSLCAKQFYNDARNLSLNKRLIIIRQLKEQNYERVNELDSLFSFLSGPDRSKLHKSQCNQWIKSLEEKRGELPSRESVFCDEGVGV